MHVLIIPPHRYVCEDSRIGSIFQHHQATALHRAGIKVGVIAPTPRSLRFLGKGLPRYYENIQFEQINGIPVYRYQGWGWATGRFPSLSLRLWKDKGYGLFVRYVEEQGVPDLVHAHNALYAGGLASLLSREYSLPIVLTEHSSIYGRRLIRSTQVGEITAALRSAQARLMVSEALGHLLENQFGAAVSPWKWVPNNLDLIFENAELLSKASISKRNFIYLNVASLIEVKNHANLLKSFAKLFRGNLTIQLRIGGDGPLRYGLECLSENLGIKNQVIFLGLLNRNQVLAEMQSCDVFVLPSNYETFGVVLIEALACGKPVIATSGSGPDSIVHKNNGMLVKVRDEEELSGAMQYMFNNVNQYDPEVIRQDCLTRFGERAIVKQLIDIYENVLSDNTRNSL